MSSSSDVSSGRTTARVALLCAVASIAACVGMFMTREPRAKIAYVRTTELIYGFSGMKEAHETYEEKRQGWQTLLDSLGADYQQSLSRYSGMRESLSGTERTSREEELRKQKENLEQQRFALEEKIREEDQRMTQGVLNQINSMTQSYGKEQGYDMILATTQSGNILYGDDAIDITKEILAVLNRNYNPADAQSDSTKNPSK